MTLNLHPLGRRMLVCLALTCGALVSVATARQAPAPQDVTSALLVEVRALRIAMEHSAAVTPRVQMTLARLNIQEQRTGQLTAQLEGVRRRLAEATASSQRLAGEIEESEKQLRSNLEPNERRGTEYELAERKRAIAANAVVEQQIRQEESAVAQLLNAEQARWIELNARLDELERLLTQVRQP